MANTNLSLERMLAIASCSMVAGLADFLDGSVEDRAQTEIDLHTLLAEEHALQAREVRAALRDLANQESGAWNAFPPAA